MKSDLQVWLILFSILATLSVGSVAVRPQGFSNKVIDNNADDQAEPTIAMHPLNPLLLVAGANSGTRAFPYVHSVKAYYSSDGGDSWTIKTNLPKPKHNAAADPSVAFDRTGNWFYGYINYYLALTGTVRDSGTVFVAKSTDNGTSWSATQVDPNKVPNDMEDKPFIAVDNTEGTYDGRIYVTWTYFDDDGGTSIKFAYSSDKALSFISPYVLATGSGGGEGEMLAATIGDPGTSTSEPFVQGSIPAVGPNGEVYVIWVAANSGSAGSLATIEVRKSTDGGESFTSLPSAASVTYVKEEVGALNVVSAANTTIAIDQNTGYVYIAWTNMDGTTDDPDLNIYYVRSTDGGANWSTPKIATERTSGWQFFPWLSVDPTGKVYLVYLEEQSSNYVDVYIAESADNGTSFIEPNLRISSESSNAGDAIWTHEYQGITSTVGLSYPVWADYRNGNADIFSARVNRSPTSNVATATRGNGQRKIVRQGFGAHHLTFESNEEIWYSRRVDDLTGTKWDYSRLSAGNRHNKFPCIAIRGSRIYVTWERKNGTTHDVHFHQSADGGDSWPDGNRQTLASSVGSADPLPVIAAYDAGTPTYKVMIVYRKGDGLYWRGSTLEGAGTWSSPQKVPETGSASKSPTLNYFNGIANLVWNDNDEIYHSDYDGSWSAKFDVASGSGTTEGKNPSSAFDGQGNLHVTWEAFDTPVLDQYVIMHRVRIGDSWSAEFHEIIQNDDIFLPAVTGHTDDDASLLFYRAAGDIIYKTRFDGSTWSNPEYVKIGAKYPATTIANPPGADAKALWTEVTGPPHKVEFDESLTLEKVNPLVTASGSTPIGWRYSRRAAIEDPVEGNSLAVQISELILTTTGETVYSIPFTDIPDTLLTLQKETLLKWLASAKVHLPRDVNRIQFDWTLFGNSNANIAEKVSQLECVGQIVDANTGESLLKLASLKPPKENRFKVQDTVSEDISWLANREVAFSFKLVGLSDMETESSMGITHVYQFEQAGQKRSIISNRVPSSIGLLPSESMLEHNYPNPFNPVTHIKYKVPIGGHVTIEILNVKGQIVRILVDEQKTNGYYTVSWDSRDEVGKAISSGVYLYRIRLQPKDVTADTFTQVKKMILLR